jgi:hypothetical protein
VAKTPTPHLSEKNLKAGADKNNLNEMPRQPLSLSYRYYVKYIYIIIYIYASGRKKGAMLFVLREHQQNKRATIFPLKDYQLYN